MMDNVTLSHDAAVASIQAMREWLALSKDNPAISALHKAHVLDMIDALGSASHITVARKYKVPHGWDMVEA